MISVNRSMKAMNRFHVMQKTGSMQGRSNGFRDLLGPENISASDYDRVKFATGKTMEENPETPAENCG